MAINRQHGFPKAIAMISGLSFALFGSLAMVFPSAFFDNLATFRPYNQHLIQDVGAFQLGLAAVLLIAVWGKADTLATALLGVGVGSLAHTASHVAGVNLGGSPGRDIPTFAIFSGLMLVAGWMRLREGSAHSRNT